MWQIYGLGNTRALCDKSMFRRTYQGTSMVRMLHTLDLTKTDDRRRLGSETESVGQSEQRPLRGLAAYMAVGSGAVRFDQTGATRR